PSPRVLPRFQRFPHRFYPGAKDVSILNRNRTFVRILPFPKAMRELHESPAGLWPKSRYTSPINATSDSERSSVSISPRRLTFVVLLFRDLLRPQGMRVRKSLIGDQIQSPAQRGPRSFDT